MKVKVELRHKDKGEIVHITSFTSECYTCCGLALDCDFDMDGIEVINENPKRDISCPNCLAIAKHYHKVYEFRNRAS